MTARAGADEDLDWAVSVNSTIVRAHQHAAGTLRPRGTGHDPGRIATELAVMLADGGESITDLALLRDQRGVFGTVAFTPTAWRLLAGSDHTALAALRTARAAAREVAWLQAAETRAGIPASRSGDRDLSGLALDFDATLVTCQSEKSRRRSPTNAASAITQSCTSWTIQAKAWPACSGRATPEPAPPSTTSPSWTRPSPRSPTPTATAPTCSCAPIAPAAPKRSCTTYARYASVASTRSSRLGIPSPSRFRPIQARPDHLWHPALEQDGSLRTGTQVAELTGMVKLEGWA